MAKPEDKRKAGLLLVFWWSAICSSTVFVACGPGKYGSSVEVLLTGGVANPESQWGQEGRRLAVGDSLFIEVDRACLIVSGTDEQPTSVTVMPPGTVAAAYGLATPGGVAKSDCFCHGNPPHCHGDCGDSETGTSSTAQTVSDAARTGVDLTESNPRTIFEKGAAPGDYAQVLLTLGLADGSTSLPQACEDMTDRTFILEGRLVNEQTGDGTGLTVDIRVTSRVIGPLEPVSAAAARPGHPAVLRIVLLLDLALSGTDWDRLGRGAAGRLMVGGETQNHPVAVSEIMAGLGDETSYLVEPWN